VVTAGGRVLAVTGAGATIERAREVAYRAAGHIRFDGMTYRRDIAAEAAGLAGEERR
jgi:phosphoribosylamine--glycine ligase